MKLIKLNIILIVLIFTQNIFAQQFYIEVSQKEVPLNYTVDITFTVENGNLEKFTPPKFNGFDAYGPMQSNQTSVINGKVSRSVSLTYTIQPKSKGTFTIPEANAIINGKKYTSKPFIITVVDAAKKPQHQQQQNAWPFDDPFSNEQQSKPKSSDQIKSEIAKNFFIKVTPNKSTVYEGDQLTLIYKVYYRIQIQGLNVIKVPSFNNFLSEEFEVDLNKEPEIESYNGQKYYTNEFRRVVLFPQKSGTIKIDPMEFQSVVIVEMPDPFFNSPFFTMPQPFEYNFKSNDLNVNVLPLPKPQPKNFSGAVGNFNFNANYDKTKVKVGEPIQLKITYTGKGNLKLISAPKLIFPDDFEAYPPKTTDNFDNNGQIVEGSKSFEYTLIPQDGGTFKMPNYEFGYFNPEQGKYITFNLPETEIEVSGKAKPSVNLLNFKKREKEELKKNELQPIFTALTHQKKIYGSTLFYSALAFPTILLLIAFAFRERNYSESELLSKRKSKANKMALKRLKYANTLMKANEEKPFYNEVIRALWQYVSDKLHITTTDLSKENMVLQLNQKNIQQDKIDDLIAVLNNCEEAIFAAQGKEKMMHQTYQTAINWITEVDITINKNNEAK